MRHLSFVTLALIGVLFSAVPPSAECFDTTVPVYDGQTWTSGCDVQVNGVVVPDTCGPVVGIQWDWGDSTVEDQWFPASHTYAQNGQYNVTVMPYDAVGNGQSEVFQLDVTGCAPQGNVCGTHQVSIECQSPNGGFRVDGGPTTVLNRGESTCVDVDALGSTVSLWSCGGCGDPSCCQFLHYPVYAGENWAIVETVVPEIALVQQDYPWTFREPMPTARSSQGAAVLDGKVYVIGGEPVSANEAYDPWLDSWTSLEPLYDLREVVTINAVGGKIYAIGGHRYGAYLSDNEEYDPIADTWTGRSPMPTARGAVAVAVGGKIYVIGGFNHAGQQLDAVEAYDPSTDSWEDKAPLPTPRSGLMVAAVEGKIYAIGGDVPGGVTNVVEEYDPATDRWTTRAPMPSAKSGVFGTAIGGKIHVFGGWYSTANDEYDTATDTWVRRTPMPAWCIGAGVALVNGRVHVFGGTGTCSKDQNLVYRPPGTPGGGVWRSEGPDGGGVHDVAVDPTMPGSTYAATYAGLFKSVNAGATWSLGRGTAPNVLPEGYQPWFVEVGPDGRVYTGSYTHGLFWSSDRGENWFSGGIVPSTVAVDPSPPFSTVYAIVSGLVHRSDDAGQNWAVASGTAPNEFPGGAYYLVASGANVFAGSLAGEIWRSSDRGANWFLAQGVAPNELPTERIAAMAAGPGGELYVALYERFGVFRTDDLGVTWEAINGTPPNDLPLGSLSSFWPSSLAVDDSGDLYIGGPEGTLFMGTDGGQSWTQLTVSVDPVRFYALASDPAVSTRLFAGTSAGVVKTENSGVDWNKASTGLRAFWVERLVLDPSSPGSIRAAGTSTGIAKSEDSGRSWEDLTQFLESTQVSDITICPSQPPANSTTFYAVAFNWEAGVARRQDGDVVWSHPTIDPGVFGGSFGPRLVSVEVDPSNPDRVFVGQMGNPGQGGAQVPFGGVFRSDDGGAVWNRVYQPSSPPTPDPGSIWYYRPENIGIDPLDPDRVYVGSLWETESGGTRWHIIMSADAGATWQEVLSGEGFWGYPDIGFDPNDPITGGAFSTVYVYHSDFFRSVNGGLTWEQLPVASRVLGLSHDPMIGGTLYGLFPDGVQLSRDRGETWERLPMVGFDSYSTRGLVVSPTSPRMIHASSRGGVYSYTAPGEQAARPEDTTNPGSFPASVFFGQAVASGDTTLAAVSNAPTLPSDLSPGATPRFYDLTTTTLYAGEVEVCLDYDPDDYTWPELDLKLYRFTEDGGPWVDVTSHVDTAARQVCGNVTELSLFVVVEPREQPDLGIPIRWCGVAGAPSIEDPSVVGEDSVNGVLLDRQTRTTDSIFLPQTGLIFRPATTASAPSFPVLADPSTAIGAAGDVFVDPDSGNFDEFLELIQACRDAWTAADPTVVGITAVHINRFVDASGTPTTLLGLGGRAEEGNCSQQMVAGRAMVVDGTYRPDDTIDKLLGHELGHGLSLRHGDGIDNDANGVLDDEGDPLDGFNVMQYLDEGSILTTAQGTRMRSQALACIPDVTVAGVAPSAGSPGTDPLGDAGTPGWADLIDMGLYQSQDETDIFNGTASSLPNDIESQFWNYVDLDDDPITGGAPSVLGFPTTSLGIELVTATTVTTFGGRRTTTTSVWIWDGNSFTLQLDPGIQSVSIPLKVGLFQDLSGPLAAVDEPAIGETVIVSIPNALLPPIAATPTIQTQTTDPATGTTDNGEAQLDLTPPVFAEVSTVPGTAEPGETVTVTASGFPPNSEIEILLGTRSVATGMTDGNGNATIVFTVPMDVRGGQRLVTAAVVGDDVAVSGAGSVIIPTAPTFAVPPTPNRGSTRQALPGIPIEWTVRASDADANDAVILEAVGLPPSATFVATTGNPAEGFFSWTPTSDQGGTWGVTFTATDDRGSAAPPVTLLIEVVTNQPPVASCRNVTVSTDPGTCMAAIVSVDAGSFDPDDDPLVFEQTPPGPYALGTTGVTLTVIDDSGLADSCTATVTVIDTEAPVVSAPTNLTPQCSAPGGVPLSNAEVQAWLALASATDNCGVATLVHDAPGFFPLDETVVTFTATDASGNSGHGSASMTVVDTVAPTIVALTATPDTLWPPNHKMREVHFNVVVTDVCDPDPTVLLQSVSSSEPDDAEGKGDGRTSGDVRNADVGTADFDMLLRSERAGGGPGRTYTVTYMATDASSNSSASSTRVYVPHDQGGVVEPILIEASGDTPTVLTWNDVPGIQAFEVIRGDLANLAVVGSNVSLGPVVCVDGAADVEAPPSGGVFFYLVGARLPLLETSFGTESAVKSRVVEGRGGLCN